MRAVLFNFHPHVSIDEQDAALRQISGWDSVSNASRLKPDARNALVQRMAYANVEDSADIEQLMQRLLQLPEVESASIPPARRLV